MRRIIDLSLPLQPGMRGVEIETAKTIEKNGWNATTLKLYSHCGTHMDAPRHFLPGGRTVDELSLDACVGPALVLNLTPVEPRELITIERLAPWKERISPGSRILLRTDWGKRAGTEAYRNELPRIHVELARWLVRKGIALLGVEPPSVADVGNREELTAVHGVLLEGGVVIVEGLVNLDQLHLDRVEFIALPLKVVAGDGTPVRAVAVEGPGM